MQLDATTMSAAKNGEVLVSGYGMAILSTSGAAVRWGLPLKPWGMQQICNQSSRPAGSPGRD
jgi:hypothetical protein